jgi:adenine deaminase
MKVDLDRIDLRIPAQEGKLRVIRAIPDQIVTGMEVVEPTLSWEGVAADPSRDLLKIAVVERHRGTGRVGLGLVTGIGLREGAIAGTVAHDHHNIVAIGADDDSLRAAIAAVVDMNGGLVVVRGTETLASLPLPVAGLMSQEPIEVVRTRLEEVVSAARGLGSLLHDPFMAMSFLALEVIPSLKITDQGLVDVERFRPVDLWTSGWDR